MIWKWMDLVTEYLNPDALIKYKENIAAMSPWLQGIIIGAVFLLAGCALLELLFALQMGKYARSVVGFSAGFAVCWLILSGYTEIEELRIVLYSLGVGVAAGLLNAFLNMGTVFYANLTDMSAEEYSETVVAPELENYTANLSYIARASNTNRKGYSWGDRFSGLPIEGKAGIVGIGLLFGLPVIYLIFRSIYDLIMKIRDNYKAGRGELRKLWRKEKKVLDKNQSSRLTAKKYKARLEKELFADKDHPGDRGIISHLPDDIFLPNTKKYQYLLKDKPDSSERVSAVKGLNYPIDRAFLLFLIENDDDKEVRKAAISKLSYPEEKETFIRCVKNQEIAGEALKKLPYAENKKIILHISRTWWNI